MKHAGRSYWESELYDRRYDLIVVGAGLTGQSISYFFKKTHPEAEVLVVDRGFYPLGASTRNAGFACFGTVGEHLADLEIESEEKLKDRIKRRYRGLLLLRETLGEEDIEYEHCGGWEIFTDSDEFKKARDQVARFNNWMEELTGEKDVYESGTYLGIPSIFNRIEGMLHPGKMMQTLYRKNRELGVEFRWNSNVKEVDDEKGIVKTADEISLTSDRIAVATNAFTETLLPEKEIKPGRGYVFVTNEIDMLEWKGTFHFNKGYVYFRNLPDNRMLIGGGRNVASEQEETSEFGINPSVKEYLINFTNEVLELPAGWTIDYEWSGIMGFSKTKTPVLEKVSDDCVVAVGLSGMGVALGMQLGREAAALF